jgi:hypothetical protein
MDNRELIFFCVLLVSIVVCFELETVGVEGGPYLG